MGYARISSKYQITIPKRIRKALSLNAGDRLYIALEGSKIVLRSFPKINDPTKVLYGSVESEKDAVEAIRMFRESGGRAQCTM